MSKTVTADAAVGSDVLRLDPRSLLVDRNIREVRLDPDFVGSIKERGVLVPITAVRTADGHVRVGSDTGAPSGRSRPTKRPSRSRSQATKQKTMPRLSTGSSTSTPRTPTGTG